MEKFKNNILITFWISTTSCLMLFLVATFGSDEKYSSLPIIKFFSVISVIEIIASIILVCYLFFTTKWFDYVSVYSLRNISNLNYYPIKSSGKAALFISFVPLYGFVSLLPAFAGIRNFVKYRNDNIRFCILSYIISVLWLDVIDIIGIIAFTVDDTVDYKGEISFYMIACLVMSIISFLCFLSYINISVSDNTHFEDAGSVLNLKEKCSNSAGKIVCKVCGANNSKGSAFCSNCGEKLERDIVVNACSICGNKKLNADDIFCNKCGHKY